jgi:uncharacterized protein (DUF1697 family)
VIKRNGGASYCESVPWGLAPGANKLPVDNKRLFQISVSIESKFFEGLRRVPTSQGIEFRKGGQSVTDYPDAFEKPAPKRNKDECSRPYSARPGSVKADDVHLPPMALIVFLRGVNVGGHRTFRPSMLARKLSAYEVVNIGAAGTLVVWKPGSRTKFRAALLQCLPFDTEVALCDSRDLLQLMMQNPFGTEPSGANIVRFVSILAKAVPVPPSLPIAFPPKGDWLVRLIGTKGQFVFGEYRRHMKTIEYLGQIDKLFAGKATTRNWNTIMAIVEILKKRRLLGD